jgi:transposase-like protein
VRLGETLVPEEMAMQAQEDRREQRLELARQWRHSGMKALAFAQEHGVTPWTLYYWRERLTSQDHPKGPRRRSRRVTLAPVHVVTQDSGADLEIVLAGGDRVRVAASVSPDRLRRVVQVLRTGC